MSTRRSGFTLMELMVVMLTVAVLGAIAVPSYQKVTYRARAARLVADMHAIRTAAHQFQAEHGRWPENAARGLPAEMMPYIQDMPAEGTGYVLDWDNWDPVVGISVRVEDPALEAALLQLLETSEGTFMRLNDRYTYFVEASFAP